MEWREVSREKFWSIIGPMENITGEIIGNYPYTSIYKTLRGEERGKIEDYYPEGKALTSKRYWLPGSLS